VEEVRSPGGGVGEENALEEGRGTLDQISLAQSGQLCSLTRYFALPWAPKQQSYSFRGL
jgi:hypothetical protein